MVDNPSNPNASVKKFVPNHFLEVIGKNLPAILESVNAGHKNTEELIQACIDQLFLSTADGRYLIQLGEQEGFTMPANSGLDIRAYRLLVPIMVSNPKQVRISVNDIVQAFYKNERTRPFIQANVIGPYSLNDGDDLIIETESGLLSFAVLRNQVANLNSVTAQEISAIINSAQAGVLSESLTARSSGQGFLRILSNTQGAGAFIRVAGGKLQNVLQLEKLIPTLNNSSTIWTITKPSALSDTVKFTWNGSGTNPNIFLSKTGDVLTIRGLVDGSAPFSLLNGSYETLDVGYDYFIIRNSRFSTLSSTLTQPADNSIIFTSSQHVTIFDRDEFATTTETEAQTITVTVPAVPPLTLRFLKGSIHLHGDILDVIDFTRNTITVLIPAGTEIPSADNFFILRNQISRFDFKSKKYQTFLRDDNTSTPTYQVQTSDDSQAALPYTVPSAALNSNPIYAEIESNQLIVSFPYPHGMKFSWGATFQGATGSSNILASDINKEHGVAQVVDDNTLVITLKDNLGQPIKYAGVAWGPADVIRQSTDQADRSDFYLQFSSPSAAAASGLVPGMLFKLNTTGGTDVDLYYASLLRFRKLVVTSLNGAQINFSAGLGTGLSGTIITGVSGVRSANIGGSSVQYYLDKTSNLNKSRVLNGLQVIMINYTKSSNPAYVGAYMYDPIGEKTTVTVSKYVVGLSDNILRGDNLPAIQVDSAMSEDGSTFPQSGQLVIDYGKNQFEGPIRYYAVVTNPGSNQIFVDPAYKFKFSHEVGAKVQYIHANTAYVPKIDGSDYPTYLTGTTTARNTMFALIKLLVAAGIFVEQDVLKPSLRYDDVSLIPFD